MVDHVMPPTHSTSQSTLYILEKYQYNCGWVKLLRQDDKFFIRIEFNVGDDFMLEMCIKYNRYLLFIGNIFKSKEKKVKAKKKESMKKLYNVFVSIIQNGYFEIEPELLKDITNAYGNFQYGKLIKKRKFWINKKLNDFYSIQQTLEYVSIHRNRFLGEPGAT